MKKTIIGFTAAAVLGAAVFTPTPAAAFWFLVFPAALMANKDPNFKAVNPYAPVKKAKRHHRKKKM